MSESSLGKTIKHARKAKKITQKELARHLKVADSTVRMWELEKNVPSTKRLKEISSILDVSFFTLAEKAGELDYTGDPLAFFNENKVTFKPASSENLEDIREAQRSNGIDLKEILKATSSTPLYYGEEFITAAQKRQILKLVKAVLEE